MEKFKTECQLILDELKKDGFTIGSEQHHQISFTKKGVTAKVNADLISGQDIHYLTPESYHDFVKGVILKTYQHEKEWGKIKS